MPDLTQSVQAALSERFGERIAVDPALPGLDELRRIAAHRVHRRYLARDVYARAAAAALRLRDVGAVEERSAAGRYSHCARQGQA